MGWFSSKSDPKFFLSTVPPEPGRVSEYLGIVSGEAVIGANLFRDMFAAVRDVVGGRAGGYERALAGARQSALDEMVAAAREKGANGIVGIDFDYEVMGEWKRPEPGRFFFYRARGSKRPWPDFISRAAWAPA